MYDALTLAAIVDELSQLLPGARVQRIMHIDRLSLGIEVYAHRRRRWLVLSADAQHARLLLTNARGDGDPERISPLLQLLKKYVQGGRIVAISQPEHERVITFTISKPDPNLEPPDGDGENETPLELITSRLILELMGRRSNIMLVDEDDRIRDSIKRVTPEMSRVRPILPGRRYGPPPPQDKLDPLLVNPVLMLNQASDQEGPLDRWLVGNWLSLSPQLAREVLSRAEIEVDTPPYKLTQAQAESISSALEGMFEPLKSGDWQPRIYQFEDGRAEFSAIPMTALSQVPGVQETACSSVLEAALRAWELGSATFPATGDRHATRRERLVAEISDALGRVRHREHSLLEQRDRAARAEELQHKGELIYTYIYLIAPGQTELTTPDGVEIILDPQLTPSENAQSYFDRYRKARSAAENLPRLLRDTGRQIAYLDQLATLAGQAESYDEIESIRMEWQTYAGETGLARPRRQSGAKPAKSARRPRRFRTSAGDVIMIGRTGPQNVAVTFDEAGPNDLWFHAREMPGSHVILKSIGAVGDESIEQAAALAAYYSQGRGSTTVPVDVTDRHYVRKIKGSGPGMVTYRNERTIQVAPKSEHELEIDPAG